MKQNLLFASRLGSLVCLLVLHLCTVTASRAAYDVASGFSTNSNPNGVWSYGSSATLGSPMTLLPDRGNWAGLDYWRAAIMLGVPGVYRNPANITVTNSTGTAVLGPGQLSFYPGPNGEFCIIRFTAPTNGLYQVTGAFTGVDPHGTTTDVHILVNGVIFSGSVNGYGAGSGPTFNLIVDLNPGDPIDFAVGRSTNSQFSFDSTGLSVHISTSNAPPTGIPPTITSQPQSRTVNAGTNVTFFVTATGTTPLSYQWRRNETNLAGATGTSLTLSNVQPANAGTYSVRVTNAFGSVISSNAVLTVLAPSTNCVSGPTGLVSWWRAEGNASDAVDGNHGTLLNGATFGAGRADQGFSLDGLDDRVVVADSPSLKFSTNDFAIEGWIQAFPATNSFGVMAILDKHQTPAPDRAVGIQFYLQDGRLSFFMADAPLQPYAYSTYTSASPNLQDGQFHHVAVTVQRQSSTGGKLYVDGQVVLTFDPTREPGDLSNTEALRIGNHANPSLNCFFKGTIDEVTVYDRSLGSNEIAAIYAAASAGKCPPPTGIPPTITSQPQSRTVNAGTNVTFFVTATGTTPLSYQWRRNETNLPGATGTSLTLSNVQPANAGTYSVRVTNAFGAVNSSNAVLTVNPVGSNAPVKLINVNFGGHLTPALSTNKVGMAAIGRTTNDVWNFYSRDIAPGQWRQNGALVNLQEADGGTTAAGLVVSNAPGAWYNGSSDPMYNSYLYPFSGNATITVTNLAVGQYDFYVYANDGNFQLSAGAVDYGIRTSQDDTPADVPVWQEGVQYARFRNIAVTNAGQAVGITVRPGVYGYAIICGLQIAQASGTAGTAPAIVTQPASQTVAAGANVTFTVTATGTAPLSYQWRRNETNLAGATGTFLTLSNVQPANAGSYSVRVTNAFGAVTSSNAVLTVLAPPTNCVSALAGLVSWWRAEGNAGDDVNGNHGTLLNGATFGAGRAGLGFSLDGVDDRVVVADSPSLKFSTNDFAIEGWIQAFPAANSFGVMSILDKHQPSADGAVGIQFYLQNGRLSFYMSDAPPQPLASSIYNSASPNLQDGQFHHVAVTVQRQSSTGGKLYVDGQAVLSFNPTSQPGNLSNTEALRIGNHADPSLNCFFKGTIDELAIYNRALSSNEIAAIHNAGSAGKCVVSHPPTITSHPTNQAVSVGQGVIFTVSATGTAPLSYQWRRNQTNLAGATGTSLILSNVQPANAGTYSVRVTNAFGAVTSSNAVLTVLAPLTNCVSAPAGLVSWWRAEGNAGDAVDGNHGTLLNGATFGAGRAGLGFSLDGVDDRVVVADSPSLKFSTNDFAIEGWIQAFPAANSFGVMSILDKHQTPSTFSAIGIQFYLQDGRLSFFMADAPLQPYAYSSYNSASPNLQDGQFHHVAVTVQRQSSVGGKLYVDGQVVLTFNPTGEPGDLSNTEALRIGNHANPELACFFKGTIDEVTVYNRALGSNEIAAIYAAGSAGKCSPPRTAEAIGLTSLVREPGTHPKLSFGGVAGNTYTVQASTNLINWEVVGVSVADSNGICEFEDLDSPELPCRYYRVVVP